MRNIILVLSISLFASVVLAAGNVTVRRVGTAATGISGPRSSGGICDQYYPRIKQKFCFEKSEKMSEEILRRILVLGPATGPLGYFSHAEHVGGETFASDRGRGVRVIRDFTPEDVVPGPIRGPKLGIEQKLINCQVNPDGSTSSTIEMKFSGDASGHFYWDLSEEGSDVCWTERINTGDLMTSDGYPIPPEKPEHGLIFPLAGTNCLSTAGANVFKDKHPGFLLKAAQRVAQIATQNSDPNGQNPYGEKPFPVSCEGSKKKSKQTEDGQKGTHQKSSKNKNSGVR